MASTTYLKLEETPQGNTDWIATYRSNLRKIDAMGKYIRGQNTAGDSMAIRVALSNGTLVDAIRVVPDANTGTLAVYLGRAGKGDRIVIESSSLYTSLNLANQNATASDKLCTIGATWSDEDGVGIGDDIQNTAVLIDPRNNLKTTIAFPPAGSLTSTNNYLGSQLQIGTDPSGVGTGCPHIKFICQTTTGTRTFLVPAYSL